MHLFYVNGSTSLFVFPPVQFRLRLQDINAAIETDSVMTAQHPLALWAPPLHILTFHESRKRIPLDKGEIFDKTRPVILLIPCVDSLQVPARESVTFITKPNSMIQKKITSFL